VLDPTQQWAIFYGALAVIIFVGSTSVTGAVFYFKRMEEHFKKMHDIANQLVVLIYQNGEQDKKLIHIETAIDLLEKRRIERKHDGISVKTS
jgi:hypothetical protein